MTKINEELYLSESGVKLKDLITNISNLQTSVSTLNTNTTQFKNKIYSGSTTSSTSFTPDNGVYLAILWINAGALIMPAMYVITKNSNGGGAVCCAESGNVNLSVSGTTVTVNAPWGNVAFYSLIKISD